MKLEMSNRNRTINENFAMTQQKIALWSNEPLARPAGRFKFLGRFPIDGKVTGSIQDTS